MNRNGRLLAVVAIALVCASIASYAVYHLFSKRAVIVGPRMAITIVAAQPIPAGTLITKDLLKAVAWPADSQMPGSFSDARQVVDRGAIVSLAVNEPLTESKLAAVGAGAGLPPTIPPGMRAISVKVNEVIGVAGFVVPGTRVDVLVTLGGTEKAESVARVAASNVQVLTAGTRFDQEKARQDGRPIPTSVVTLLVSPEDAERLTLAQAEGRITLTLRNPLDTLPTETQGAHMSSLMGLPAAPPPAATPVVRRRTPAPAVEVAAKPPDPAKPYTVEAIRGAKRTEEQVRSNGEETIKE